MKPVVSIAIINWNTRDRLKECLNSIYDHLPACDFEIVVLDNASTDGSADLVRTGFSQVRLVANQSNAGYASAANQAVRGTEAKYVFVLNSDTKVFPQAVDSLLAFAEGHPDAGAIGPRLVNSDGTLQLSCRRFPSLGIGVGHALLSLFFPGNPYTRRYQLADWDHAISREVDWVSGAAMFLRRDAVSSIGLFDERYFMYAEDLDLCYRLWQENWKVYYQPTSVVMHHVAQSSSLITPKMIMEHHRSLYRFISKSSTGYMRLMNLPIGASLMIRGGLTAGLSIIRGGPGRGLRESRQERRS